MYNFREEISLITAINIQLPKINSSIMSITKGNPQIPYPYGNKRVNNWIAQIDKNDDPVMVIYDLIVNNTIMTVICHCVKVLRHYFHIHISREPGNYAWIKVNPTDLNQRNTPQLRKIKVSSFEQVAFSKHQVQARWHINNLEHYLPFDLMCILSYIPLCSYKIKC